MPTAAKRRWVGRVNRADSIQFYGSSERIRTEYALNGKHIDIDTVRSVGIVVVACPSVAFAPPMFLGIFDAICYVTSSGDPPRLPEISSHYLGCIDTLRIVMAGAEVFFAESSAGLFLDYRRKAPTGYCMHYPFVE